MKIHLMIYLCDYLAYITKKPTIRCKFTFHLHLFCCSSHFGSDCKDSF